MEGEFDYKDIVLGKKYKDAVTGFIGTATAKAEYQFDHPSIQLESMVDGKPAREWYSLPRISRAYV
ncbi:MAG TPA: hypothetical protein DIW44_12395 [Anaerolineaceae bacterium]|nr:hypothetical protein [Anaerolineaceae bacterium]